MQQRNPAEPLGDNSITQQSSYEPVEQDPAYEPQGMGKSVEDVTTKAKDMASEYGQKAQDQADKGVEKAAEGMQSAAEKIRERTYGQDGFTAQAGTRVADTMESTATYLRDHDTAEMLDDVEKYVREHPMQALAGALVGGFVIARLLR